MNPENGYHSSTARLTISYGVIVLLLVVTLQGAVFLLTRNALESEISRVVGAELENMARDYKGGMGNLVLTLRQRSGSWQRLGAIYLLSDPSLRKIEGNLSGWPGEVEPRSNVWVRFSLKVEEQGQERTHPVTAHIVQLEGGSWLLVGTDTSEMQRNLRRFGWATVWGIGAITALIALLGRWYVTRTARRVRAFSAACDSIVHSDLSRRLELANTGDEYDQLSRTVNDMLERLEQQAGLLRTAFGSIAHDLRTPLYRLRVRLEEALLHAGNEESRELVGPALDELDRMQRTLATLLEIARAEGGSTVAGSESVDLTGLVEEMYELYLPGMQEKGMQLTLDAAPGVTMMGKRQLLAQLVANLLENAMKYVPEGGKVAMSLHGDERRIELVVSDNGPGIPLADRERAQEPFVTLQTVSDKPSSGLGLSLVKAIVKLHRGELVLADNEPGLRVECRFERDATALPVIRAER